MATCKTCAGFGKVGGGPCSSCGGSGQVPEYHSGPGGSKNACFPGYTKITTSAGLRRIDSLKKGDMIVSISESGSICQREIMRVAKHRPTSIMTIATGKKSFDVTSAHSLQTQRGWLKAEQIKVGDKLIGLSPESKLVEDEATETAKTNQMEPVYNLIVEGSYTFVADGYIAHSFTYFRKTRILLYELIYNLLRLKSKKKSIFSDSHLKKQRNYSG